VTPICAPPVFQVRISPTTVRQSRWGGADRGRSPSAAGPAISPPVGTRCPRCLRARCEPGRFAVRCGGARDVPAHSTVDYFAALATRCARCLRTRCEPGRFAVRHRCSSPFSFRNRTLLQGHSLGFCTRYARVGLFSIYLRAFSSCSVLRM